jgi:membrane fusion protein (multidrug efflux system)
MEPGEKVHVSVDAMDGGGFDGTLSSLAPASGALFSLLPPENATGNFTKVVQRVPVRILVTKGCGNERPLRPGMSVEAHVVTKS